MIGFIGSVFSPWYAWSGRGNPANHCCMNVATYGKGGKFAMTDRGETALTRHSDTLEIGPSSMSWNGETLIIDIDEISSLPKIGRLRGQVRLTPTALTGVELPLTKDGAHVWRPFAPTARIDVDLNDDQWRWSGHGYFDANFGTRPLEADFSYWTWGRFPSRGGSLCLYDSERRDGSDLSASFRFGSNGSVEQVKAGELAKMKRTGWYLKRQSRADLGHTPVQIKPMLDAPFYSRSVVETQIDGERLQGVHEALDLDRYASRWLKPMLAVRVPRKKVWRSRMPDLT
ncbi:carotenoid 1,2-hydratase [Aestuariibius insulae]|uniref:carotenoid 1,2-hydratase n=1 Tax=Aestuariibius insulae TaxID=2058287 RepID=UPI00345E955F